MGWIKKAHHYNVTSAGSHLGTALPREVGCPTREVSKCLSPSSPVLLMRVETAARGRPTGSESRGRGSTSDAASDHASIPGHLSSAL